MEANNMAKMREALTESRNLLHRLANLTSAGKEHWAMAKVRAEEIVNITSEKIPAMIMQISAALAAPPRNCDVGSVDEQIARFDAECLAIRSRNTVEPCAGCPLSEHGEGTEDCQLRWAQMPYEEGGAK